MDDVTGWEDGRMGVFFSEDRTERRLTRCPTSVRWAIGGKVKW